MVKYSNTLKLKIKTKNKIVQIKNYKNGLNSNEGRRERDELGSMNSPGMRRVDPSVGLRTPALNH